MRNEMNLGANTASPLDPGFQPAVVFNRNYVAAVRASGKGVPLVLGLEARDMVLLVLTIVGSMLTFGTGRTNILFGFVHLLVFAVFVFLVLVP